MKHKVFGLTIGCILLFIFLYPLIFLLVGSFMNKYDVQIALSPIFERQSNQFITWSLIPERVSLQAYIELLLDTPEFFIVFWNSAKIVFFIILGQMIIAIPASWTLYVSNWKHRKIILVFLIILMMIPFILVMVTQYKILKYLTMIDSLQSIIVPAIFSSLPVFIIYIFFSKIPKQTIEAARIDGANEFQVIYKIGIPLGYPGILSAAMLSFIEYWNLIEQPLAFIKNPKLTTLPLYLPRISIENININMVASVITIIPPLLVFIIGFDFLENGISSIFYKKGDPV